MTDLICEVSIEINVPKSRVWNALTDPEEIKKYLFGTNTITDWKKGSPIKFIGEWEGKAYEDKGTIFENEKEKILKYSYWSAFSGREDIPENHQTVTYILTEGNGKTFFKLSQDNCFSEEAKKHSEENWRSILNKLKQLLEQK
jgi:uncharacterized protein YndB with AHSA1/START domain